MREHHWVKLHRNSFSNDRRKHCVVYECRLCGKWFNHYYNLEKDFNIALRTTKSMECEE